MIEPNSLLKNDKWQEIFDLYSKDYMSMAKIADKIGCSVQAVREAFIKKGVARRKCGSKKFINKELLEKLYTIEGKTLSEIASIIKVCPGTVYNYLKKFNIPVRKAHEYLRHDFSGKEFGSWVVSDEYKIIDGNGKWKTLCRECNEYHWVEPRSFILQKSQRCRDCEMKRRFKGYEEIRAIYWRNTQRGAFEREFEFSITIEYAWEIFIKQNRKCALTNIPLEFGYKHYQTASLDRIDSSKGYIEGNVQWVHKDVNRMKWEYDEPYFKTLCCLVAKNSPEEWMKCSQS